jgi:hypothetical protein
LAVAILILGITWLTVGALGKAATATADREIKTGLALRAAKYAVLAHVAQYAARSDTADPGQLPCPESVNLTIEGTAASNCGNAMAIGRLPWKSLGIDQLRDGDGEPLWYVISPGFRNPPINFDTDGQLSYKEAPNAAVAPAVALVIAPGHPLPVGGCNTVNQQVVTRNVAPLVVSNFLECGNITGNYANPGISQWNNDRVIAITAAEWMDAIAGPVADRIQRQVMPALNTWRTTESVLNWGVSFAAYASSFAPGPAGNDYCGDYGMLEGMLPIASSSASNCGRWSSGSVSSLPNSILDPSIPPTCSAGAAAMQCTFSGQVIAAGLFSARITVTAANVAGSFRAPISAANISVTPPAATLQNFSLALLPPSTGNATLTIDVSQPMPALTWSNFTVTIPNLPDAAVLSTSMVTNPRMAWFLNNGWAQHVYYAVSPAAVIDPGGNVCDSTGDVGCLTVNGLPAPTNDKRFVLALMGRRLASQPAKCVVVGDCLEDENASTFDRIFVNAASSSAFNDRLAACPFQLAPHNGAPVQICN